MGKGVVNRFGSVPPAGACPDADVADLDTRQQAENDDPSIIEPIEVATDSA
jgi:hypothetical protein